MGSSLNRTQADKAPTFPRTRLDGRRHVCFYVCVFQSSVDGAAELNILYSVTNNPCLAAVVETARRCQ